METRHNPAGFDYEIIAKKKEYALIKMESTEEYKIVSDICADGSWAYTVCSWMYGKYGREEYLVMQNAIDSFRYKTEKLLYSTFTSGRTCNTMERYSFGRM